jgi:hypothetical protein
MLNERNYNRGLEEGSMGNVSTSSSPPCFARDPDGLRST